VDLPLLHDDTEEGDGRGVRAQDPRCAWGL
jgi:hypothetical protein